jgi:hypothetical protein
MPVTYVIDSSKKLIRTTCSPPLLYEEVIHHFHELRKDPACTGYLDVLLHVSDIDRIPKGNQLAAVSAEVRALRKKVRFGACGIVAARDAIFGMMRVFEVLSGDYFGAIRVFREAAEAERWLASQQQPADPGRKV